MTDIAAAAALLEEAAFDPERLPQALERAGQILNFDHFYLVRMEPNRLDFICAPEFKSGIETYMNDGWWQVDDRTHHCQRALRPNTLIREQAIYSEDTKAKSIICNEFFRPMGWDWLAGWQVDIMNETWGLAGMRTDRFGPVSDQEAARLAAFMPTANRAVQMAVQLREARVTGTVAGIEAAGSNAIILDHTGRVSVATPAANRLFDTEFGISRGALWAADRDSHRALSALSHLARTGGRHTLAQDCIVRRTDGRRPIVIRPVPVRGSVLDVLPGARFVLMLNDLDAQPRPDAEGLRELFGLTPRESEVTALLANGMAPQAISDQLCITLITVRDYIKSILAKTGCNRQSELAALLARLPRG